MTARTQARDLQWHFDPVRRLSDAQIRRPGDSGPSKADRLEHYIEPGVLWWAFDPKSAIGRGAPEDLEPPVTRAKDPGKGPSGNGSVILIDEIDKADPDVPNNLLEPLGSLQFTVHDTGMRVQAEEAPLVVVTTNDERELPAAFQRRCVVLYIEQHQRSDLMRIAMEHFARHEPPLSEALAGRVADVLIRLREEATRDGHRPPSTAEYLDAVRACLSLRIEPDGQGWADIEQLTLSKQRPAERERTWPRSSD
jgi:MoxR-like ATPase